MRVRSGTRFGAFRDCICVFECQKWVRRASRSSSNLFDVDDASLIFFSEPVSGPPKWNSGRRNAKKNAIKNRPAPVMWLRTDPILIQAQVWAARRAFFRSLNLLWWQPAGHFSDTCFNFQTLVGFAKTSRRTSIPLAIASYVKIASEGGP